MHNLDITEVYYNGVRYIVLELTRNYMAKKLNRTEHDIILTPNTSCTSYEIDLGFIFKRF